MKVNILHLLEGAEQARGLVVIIDVFRAFTVEPYLVNNGVERLIAVGDKDLAYAFRDRHRDALLIGERGGITLPGFDYGNSPSQIRNVDFSGKTVVHTTSAGTRGIARARLADEILTGGLVNARAVANYAGRGGHREVSLVGMGLGGRTRAGEDDLCAAYLAFLLRGGDPIDFAAEADKLRRGSGAKFFDPALRAHFPEEDFHLCLQRDIFPFVLRVRREASGLNEVEKVAVD